MQMGARVFAQKLINVGKEKGVFVHSVKTNLLRPFENGQDESSVMCKNLEDFLAANYPQDVPKLSCCPCHSIPAPCNPVGVDQARLATQRAQLVGRIVYNKKRLCLMIEDSTGSVPISLLGPSLDPVLLNSLVLILSWQTCKLEKWNDSCELLDSVAWLGLQQHPPKPKRARSSPSVYFEVQDFVQLTSPICSPASGLSLQEEVSGMVVGISPVFSSSSLQRYWILELHSRDVILFSLQMHEGLRLLLRIGECYKFSQLKRSEVLVESYSFVACRATVHTQIAKTETIEILKDDSESCQEMSACSYRGCITNVPAMFVYEMDNRFKAIVNAAPVENTLGFRPGAQVLFQYVCKLRCKDSIVGFEGNLRTRFEVVQFSKDTNSVCHSFSTRRSEIRQAQGGAWFCSLESYCLVRHRELRSSNSQATHSKMMIDFMLEHLKDDCRQHLISKFLHGWEKPIFNWSPFLKLAGMQEVIGKLWNSGVLQQNRMFVRKSLGSENIVAGSIHTSPFTGQLCFHDWLSDMYLPCITNLEKDSLLGTDVILRDFNLIVERYNHFPSFGDLCSSLRMQPPSQLGVAFHGHICRRDGEGMTLVYLEIASTHALGVRSLPVTVVEYLGSSSFRNGVFSTVCKHNEGKTTYCTNQFPESFGLWQMQNADKPQSVAQLLEVNSPRVSEQGFYFLVAAVDFVDATNQGECLPSRATVKNKQLRITAQDLWSPLKIAIYININGRVLPPYVCECSTSKVFRLYGDGIALNGNPKRLKYVKAGEKSDFAYVHNLGMRTFQFPRDFALMPVQKLYQMRNKPVHYGMCCIVQVTTVIRAMLHVEGDELKFEALVEVDDGTDQGLIFVDGDEAVQLLRIDTLMAVCAPSCRALRKLEYRHKLECEKDSPQGIFREKLLQAVDLLPRRVFLVKDRPMNKDKRIPFHSDETLLPDHSRQARVRDWQGAHVTTKVSCKVMAKLVQVDPCIITEQLAQGLL